MQTVTIRPRESKAIEPQSERGFASEVATRFLPSGPRPGYASVIQVSLWMFEPGFFAM